MAKLSALDKAIAQLEHERAVLEAAIARLKAQRDEKKPKSESEAAS